MPLLRSDSARISAAVSNDPIAGLILEQLVQRKVAYGDVRALSRLACVSKAFARTPWPASVVLERSALCHRSFIAPLEEPPEQWWSGRLSVGLSVLAESCVALAHELRLAIQPATVLSAAREEDEERREQESAADAIVRSGAELQALALAEVAVDPLYRVGGSASERAYRACVLFCAAIGSMTDGTGVHWCLPLLPASKECFDTLLELLPALRSLATAPQPPAELRALLILALGHAAAALDDMWGRCGGSVLCLQTCTESVEAEVSEAEHCLKVCLLAGGAQVRSECVGSDYHGHESLPVPKRGVAAAMHAVRGSVGRAIAFMVVDIKSDTACNQHLTLAECAHVLCDTFVDEAAPNGERGRAARALAELARSDANDWECYVEHCFAESGASKLADKLGGDEIFYHRSPQARRERMCRPLDLHVEAKHLAKAVKHVCGDAFLLMNENDTDDGSRDDSYDDNEESWSGREDHSSDEIRFNDRADLSDDADSCSGS